MRIALASTVAAALLATLAVPSAATGPAPTAAFMTSGSTPVAIWEMNEPTGTTTMWDSSGNDRHGSVGSSVRTGQATDTGLGYKWPYKAPNQPPAEPERLVTISDGPGLDPGEGTYTLTFRFRTTQNFGNYLQKGQATTAGGQVKVQAPKGIVNCLFKGSLGRSSTGSKTPLNDGEWHTVTCVRDSNGVTMYVDGAFRSRNRKASGEIDNAFPITIGGKPKCDQIKVTCDYYTGDFDYVRIDVG